MYKTKKSIIIALLVAQGLVLSIVESWFPLNFMVPGIKLGFANIVTLVSLTFFGLKDTIMVVVIRCLLSAIFVGNIILFIFSVAGGILSILIMHFLMTKASKYFSLIGISMAGAIAHNFGQLLVAVLILNNLSLFYYLPVLIISGLIMGFIVGYCSSILCNFLKKSKLIIFK